MITVTLRQPAQLREPRLLRRLEAALNFGLHPSGAALNQTSNTSGALPVSRIRFAMLSAASLLTRSLTMTSA